MNQRRSFLTLGAGALLAALVTPLAGAPAARAAPAAELLPYWLRQDPQSRETVDYGIWAAFLQRYLKSGADGINRIDYRQALEAKAGLAAHIGELAAVRVTGLTRDTQRAYWVNLYNALTVVTVMDHYPVDSIRDIDISGLFANGPWGAELVQVEGIRLSLDDIEHRILRPIWRDPRLHYAVNCAAVGCPNLQPEPFAAERMEAQLEAAARAFVNHPRGARVEAGALTVSSLYDWYEADFGGSDRSVLAHLRHYAEPPLARRLAGIERIAGHAYDWTLADTRLAARA